MKTILILITLLIFHDGYGQDCIKQAANKASTLERGQDEFIGAVSSTQKPPSWDITKMKLNLGKAESWIKNKLAGFTGTKLDYSNNYYLDYDHGGYGENFYKATGMKGSYGSKLRFFAYYCYDNNPKINTEAESGSFMSVIFNNVFISDLCTDVGVFTVNGKPAFKVLEKSKSEGRKDFYDMRATSNVNDTLYTSKHNFIIIRNSDKPVFISITRKEYLEQMLKDIETYKVKATELQNSVYKSQLKSFEEEMRIYKTKDKSYTAEKEAKRRKWFNEDVNPEKLAGQLKKMENEVKDTKQLISEYLGKPNEWLGRGFTSFYSGSFETYDPRGVKKYFDKLDTFSESKEDFTRSEIVSINPAYFNTTMGSDVPQLIMVHLSKKSYAHMLKVTKLIMEPNALVSLEAMLNSGK